MNRNHNICRLILCVICSFFFRPVSAQVASKNDLVKITAVADTFRNRHPVEKLYLQFDKPYYAIGDTIWFKAYLFNAAYLTASKKSGILYIELTNDNNNVVTRMMLPVADGLSWGDIPLRENEIPEGSYTLRAYTNWMRNFGEDYIFKRDFYIGTASKNTWLVNSKINLFNDNGIEKANIALQFNLLNKEPLILRDMRLNVMDGKRRWYKNEVRTKMDGSLNVDFMLKSPAKQITLIAKDNGKDNTSQKLIIPITLSRPENTDLQFMPEGGYLVAGLPARVGFKAIGEDGRAMEIEGNVYDSRQQSVASFKSTHKGLGSFDLVPQAGETYEAKVVLPGGLVKTFALPPVKSAGTVLKIRDIKDSDSLAITITGTRENDSYYLIGQSRETVCYAAVVHLANNAAKIKIAATAFPTGIAHFTLLNAAKQSLNERIIFINHHDNLQIAITPDKQLYQSRDSIALQIKVTDKYGMPVKGSFSLAVTDDAQVKTDSSNNNIISSLLLTSDLKGDIDEPGYYFQADKDGYIKQQLDNLLLTQGWVGYDWKDIFAPITPVPFAAEQEFAIKGKVINVFSKPVANTHVIVFSKKPAFVLDTITDKNGQFIFRNIVPLDTPVYMVQARNKNGKSFNVGVDVDEFKPPVFTASAENITPWYVNSDTSLMNYVKNNITIRAVQEKVAGSGHMLKEVVINAKKNIKDSQNLNGPGNADLVLDEKDLEKAGKKTWLQVLKENIKGFKTGDAKKGWFFIQDLKTPIIIENGMVTSGTHEWYFINDKPVKFYVDGISVTDIYPTPLFEVESYSAGFQNVTDYLNATSAEDIKGIELNVSDKYTGTYFTTHVGEYALSLSPDDYAFIEITTRSGHGPAIIYTPGIYLYKPLPFSLPNQFYSPRYTVKNKNTVDDYRSTIFWAPNVLTDKGGKAAVSFYSTGKTGTYTVIIEGTEGNGTVGSQRSKIKLSGK